MNVVAWRALSYLVHNSGARSTILLALPPAPLPPQLSPCIGRNPLISLRPPPCVVPCLCRHPVLPLPTPLRFPLLMSKPLLSLGWRPLPSPTAPLYLSFSLSLGQLKATAGVAVVGSKAAFETYNSEVDDAAKLNVIDPFS